MANSKFNARHGLSVGSTPIDIIDNTGAVNSPGSVTAAVNLVSNFSAGDEGGEVQLAKPQTNTTIAGAVSIDVYQNKLRIFENGGTSRGVYVDLTTAGAGVTTNLLASSGSGTVTSVGLSVPTGLSVSGTPITDSGTLAIGLESGYSIPTTSSQTNWDTAYSWGNHASAGYLSTTTAASTYQPLSTNLNGWSAIATSSKQDALVSGTNIKTVNSNSLLGSGNLALFAGGLIQVSVVAALPGMPDANTLYVVTG